MRSCLRLPGARAAACRAVWRTSSGCRPLPWLGACRAASTSDVSGGPAALDGPAAAAASAAADLATATATPSPSLPPGLYVVGTPIGNLADLTPRAAAILTGADCVLCEDTRHSGPLLARAAALRAALGPAGLLPPLSPSPSTPRPPLVSLHAHNEAARTSSVLARLAAGQAVALISDAGTPLLSDPGGGLVAAAVAAGHAVTPIPGPCAAVAALSAAGLAAGDFLFLGFLSSKSAARRAALARLRSLPAALVLYVPARSLAATLADAAAALGPARRCAVGRELTKRHEEWWRGGVGEGAEVFKARGGDLRGEVTLVLERPAAAAAVATHEEGGEGGGSPSVDAEAALVSLLADGVPPSAAARALAKALGVPRAGLYAAAVAWREEQGGGEK